MKQQLLIILGCLLTTVMSKNIKGKEFFTINDNDLHRRGHEEANGDDNNNNDWSNVNRVDNKPTHDEHGEQLFHIQNVEDNRVIPGSSGASIKEEDIDNGDGPKKGQPLLRTELAVTTDVSIFAGYARDYESVGQRFNSKREFTVVMAPKDEAVVQLGAKPWEFPTPVDPSLTEKEKEEVARRNILWFLLSHMHYGEIEQGGLIGKMNNKFVIYSETGEKLTVEPEDEKLVITSKGIKATVSDARPVENGVIWILDNCLVTV